MNKDKMFFVTFRGIPDWEGETTKSYVQREYLFDSFDKASAFVRERTKGEGWETHPTCLEGSMLHRIKKCKLLGKIDSQFEYVIGVIIPNEECKGEEKGMPEIGTHEFVNKVEDDLRKVEADLESIGRTICSVNGSGSSWASINNALEDVRDAIHNAFLMRPVE